MRVDPVTYMHGGFSLEIVGETPVEVALLKQIFEHGSMTRGNGKSLVGNGCSTGFYLAMQKAQPPAERRESDNDDR